VEVDADCRLIAGYTAKSAAFAKEGSLDKVWLTSEYYTGFFWLFVLRATELYGQRVGRTLYSWTKSLDAMELIVTSGEDVEGIWERAAGG